MFEGAVEGLAHVISVHGLLLALAATFIGTAAAILPGVSPVTMMALLLPAIFGMDKYDAFLFLAALMAAGGFAGSVTSILLNVPGDGINAAETLDGFPMARQGRAGVAIGASAAASGLGALFGLALLVLILPFVRGIILAFSPPEFFALAVAGIVLVATVSAKSPMKGIASGLFGMMLAFIGLSIAVGGTRYTFGIVPLQDGISLIPALIGLFALPELFEMLRRNESINATGELVKGGVWQGVREVLHRPALLIRSSLMGSAIGVIPGVGGSVASWVAYFAAERGSKDPRSFGKGNVEGVIAPAAALDAKEGGSMLPVLALGIPGSVSTAVLLAAFQIKGVLPGQRLFENDMPLIWVLILAMVLSNVLTSLLGLAFANQLIKITLVPAVVLAPIVFVLGGIGAYADQQSVFGLILMLVFGLLGWIMVRLDYPRPPLLIGLILMPIAEENFHISVQISRGDYDFLLRPISLAIFAVIAAAFLVPPLIAGWRRAASRRIDRQSSSGAALEILGGELSENDTPATLGHVLFPVALLALVVLFFATTFGYRPEAQLFPILVFVPLSILLSIISVRAVQSWRTRVMGTRVAHDPDERSTLWVAVWAVSLPIGMAVIGIIPGAGLYMAAFLLFFERRRPEVRRAVVAIAAGVLIAVASQAIFGNWLGMRLGTGIF